MLEDNEIPDLREHHHKFYEDVISKLGDPTIENDFPSEDLIPTYDAYVDGITQGKPNATNQDLEPTSKSDGNYVNEYVMLPLGDPLSRRRVIEHKCDADGNPFGRSNNNTIIESSHYLVKFEDNEVFVFNYGHRAQITCSL